MRTLYAKQWTEKITTGHSLKVYSDKILPGWVLDIQACFFHVPESTVGSLLTIYLENGGQNIVMRSREMTKPLNGMSIFNPFPLGEGDRIYGYAKDANVGDYLILNLVGEMVPVTEWRNYLK